MTNEDYTIILQFLQHALEVEAIPDAECDEFNKQIKELFRTEWIIGRKKQRLSISTLSYQYHWSKITHARKEKNEIQSDLSIRFNDSLPK